MQNPFFFGYGSLVNRATHNYSNCHKALVSGWRREWVSTAGRPFAYLSASRDAAGVIAGLAAEVPGGDWAELDLREAAYSRIPLSEDEVQTISNVTPISIYSVSDPSFAQHPILLSYLDVVLQGYLTEFGQSGVENFMATTSNWDIPVLNDRAAPLYPRHQVLDASQTRLVDAMLTRIEARVVKQDAT